MSISTRVDANTSMQTVQINRENSSPSYRAAAHAERDLAAGVYARYRSGRDRLACGSCAAHGPAAALDISSAHLQLIGGIRRRASYPDGGNYPAAEGETVPTGARQGHRLYAV
jgi:hypothetical protein